MTGQAVLATRLARRFASSSATRRSGMFVAVVATLIAALFVVVSGFNQTPQQVTNGILGSFNAELSLVGVVGASPGDDATVPTVAQAIHRAGVDRSTIELKSLDVRPAVVDAPNNNYRESDWAHNPPASTYRLTSGRWPTAPGEVVVTDGLVAAAGDAYSVPAGGGPAALSVLSGLEKVTVVGRVVDTSATDSRQMLAAPGTWASWDSPMLAQRYKGLNASPIAYWSGGGPPQRVEAEILHLLPGDQAHQVAANPPPDLLLTRAQLLAHTGLNYLDSIPLAYQVPSLLLPFLAALSALGLNARRFRRQLGVLRSVGVPVRPALAALVLATTAWSLAGAVAGSLLGVGIGLLVRIPAAGWVNRPLAPVPLPGIVSPLMRAVIVVVTAFVLALLAMAVHQPSGARRARAPRWRPSARVRRVLAAAVAALLIVQAAKTTTVPGALLFPLTTAALVCLLVPDVVPAVLGRLPATTPGRRLAWAQLRADTGRGSTTVAITAAVLGLSFAMVIMLQALTASENASHFSQTAPGQIVLNDGGAGPPSPDLVTLAVKAAHAGVPPIHIWYTNDDQRGAALVTDNFGLGQLAAVDTVDEVGRLLKTKLTPAARRALTKGGILRWHASDAPRLQISDTSTGTVERTTPALPSAVVTPPPAWSTISGMILLSTAKELGLPLRAADVVLTGLSGSQSDAVSEAALAAAYDPYQVQPYSPPDPVVAPAAYVLSAVGLAALLLLLTLTTSRANAATLRPYLGGLVALGIRPAWCRAVLNRQVALVGALSLLLGVVIAVPPVVLANLVIPPFVLSVPYLQVIALVALFVAAGAFGTWSSSRRLRAEERSMV